MEPMNNQGTASHAIIFIPNDFLRQAINSYPIPVGIPSEVLCGICNDYYCEHVGTRLMMTWVPKEGPLDALHIYYGSPPGEDEDPKDRQVRQVFHSFEAHNPGVAPMPTGGDSGNGNMGPAASEAPPNDSTQTDSSIGETQFYDAYYEFQPQPQPEFFNGFEPKAEFQNFEAEPEFFNLEPEPEFYNSGFEPQPEFQHFEAEPKSYNGFEPQAEFQNFETETEFLNVDPEPEPQHVEVEPEFYNIEPEAEFYNSFSSETGHISFENEIGFRNFESGSEAPVSPFCTIETLTRQFGELSCSTQSTPGAHAIYDPNYSNYGPPQNIHDLQPQPMTFEAAPRHRNFQPRTRNWNKVLTPGYNYPQAATFRPPRPTKSQRVKPRRRADGSYLIPCQFCLSNGETPEVYHAHQLRNKSGVVECPILRNFVCPTCNATGDNAHTEKYCPDRNDTLHVYKKVRTAFGKFKILRY